VLQLQSRALPSWHARSPDFVIADSIKKFTIFRLVIRDEITSAGPV